MSYKKRENIQNNESVSKYYLLTFSKIYFLCQTISIGMGIDNINNVG